MTDEIREDDIILDIVREQGCQIPSTVQSIRDFDAALFFHTAGVCLSVWHASQGDGQPAYPTKLPGGKAQQFRIGTSMAEDVRKMGYTGEVGYESFLYPTEAGMKRLLRFLVDKLPKPESESAAVSEATASGGLMDARRVLKEWTNRTWSKTTRAPAVHPIRTIPISLPSAEASAEARDYYASLQPLVSAQPRSFASLAPSLLAAHSLELVRKDNVLDEFSLSAANSESAARIKALLKNSFGAAIREREALSAASRGTDLSQYSSAGISRSAFGRRTEDEKARAEAAASLAATSATAVDGQTAEEREAALQAEREKQLAELQGQLDEVLAHARSIDQSAESLQAQSRQLESELTTLLGSSRDMEESYLVKKRTLDLLPDAANNLAELQKLVAASSARLVDLAREWENYRLPLVNKLRRAQQLFHERKAEIGNKILLIKRLREEMKEKATDLREKEKLNKLLLEELNSLPKSINRQVYVKRIMDLMKNISRQSDAIRSVLADVRSLQKEINLTSASSARSFGVADEIIFQQAKKNPKDDAMMKTYKHVVHLREGFVELVQGVEAKGRIANEMLALQTSIDDLNSRNTSLNSDRVEADLAQIKKENKELQAKIKAMQK